MCIRDRCIHGTRAVRGAAQLPRYPISARCSLRCRTSLALAPCAVLGSASLRLTPMPALASLPSLSPRRPPWLRLLCAHPGSALSALPGDSVRQYEGALQNRVDRQRFSCADRRSQLQWASERDSRRAKRALRAKGIVADRTDSAKPCIRGALTSRFAVSHGKRVQAHAHARHTGAPSDHAARSRAVPCASLATRRAPPKRSPSSSLNRASHSLNRRAP